APADLYAACRSIRRRDRTAAGDGIGAASDHQQFVRCRGAETAETKRGSPVGTRRRAKPQAVLGTHPRGGVCAAQRAAALGDSSARGCDTASARRGATVGLSILASGRDAARRCGRDRPGRGASSSWELLLMTTVDPTFAGAITFAYAAQTYDGQPMSGTID